MLPGARSLRIREFKWLWIGQTVSQLGDAVYFLVFLFLAQKVSGNPAVVGTVMALAALPFVVLGPIAGVAADKVDRRKLMAGADFASALILAGFAAYAYFEPLPPIWLIGVMAFSLSCVNAFFMPARTAAIPALVPRELLMDANALAIASQQLMGMIGLALSASVLGLIFQVAPAYFLLASAALNALTFAISGAFILKLPALKPETGSGAPSGKLLKDIKAGLKVVRADIVLRLALPITIVSNLFIAGFMVMYAAINDDWYGGRFSTLAWLEFGFAAAMVVTTLAISRITIRRPGTTYAVATLVVGLLVAGMCWGRGYWQFMTLNVLCGVAVPFAWLSMNVYIQTAFKDEFRGRIASVWTAASVGMHPVGLAVIGPLAAWLGLANVFLVMGFGMCAATLIGLLNRSFMRAEMPGF
ncbi:MAG: MFS transporter [Armatimonadetes bacterium]|nr:MFS transporter [Armatimonadota bacterium]